MRDFMKKILAIILVAITLLSFVSCSSSGDEKVFRSGGMEIILSDAFKENSSVARQYGYTVVLESGNIVIFALKEDKELCVSAGINSLSEYARAIRNNNSAKNPGSIQEVEGLKYTFEYKFYNPDQKTYYSYFTVMYEAQSSYWFVQLTCKTENYEELRPELIKYAKTVSFYN